MAPQHPEKGGDPERRAQILDCAEKLLAHYGPGNVPTSEELWGMNWFEPTFDLWAPAPNRSSAPAPG